MSRRFAAALVAALSLSACVSAPKRDRVAPAPAPQAAPAPAPSAEKPKPEALADARSSGVAAGPAISSLDIDPAAATRALQAFRLSCPALLRRSDVSGLTRNEDWRGACDAAKGWADADARSFFEQHFETVRVGEGSAFATGYFEPEIAGSRTRAPGYEVPVYRRPPDLVEADLGLFSDEWKGKRIRGRVEAGKFVLYHDRAAIEDGALAGRNLEIAWAADPIELFFLQIQGSGRLRLPDGGVMRIGYDTQNGRDYTAIGRVMRERGIFQPGQATMQGIVDWLRAHPEEGRAIMRENKSYVFFRELTGPGPLGALGVPVTGRATVAADPKFVPLGAPVWLDVDAQVADGLWIAQDTGGAIKGANRFDTFWGAGDEARTIAGGMSSRGGAFLLLPKGTLARLQAETPRAEPPTQS